MINKDFEDEFKTILNFLIEERKRQKITQNEMAKSLNMLQQTYGKIESGTQKMTAQQLLQITRILRIDLKLLEGFSASGLNSARTTELDFLQHEIDIQQKHIKDLQTLIEQQQRIIEKLTSRGG